MNQFGLSIPAPGRFDLLALGGMTIREDPGDIPYGRANTVNLSVSGGEFNVAANLAKCFRMNTAIATAMVDGSVEGDRVLHGIDEMHVEGIFRHFDFNGVTGPFFSRTRSDRGWPGRSPLVQYNRANEAAGMLKPGDCDWDKIFGQGIRWVHSGGIFASLSPTTGPLILEMFQEARKHGIVTSFDLNYRPLLWRVFQGGQARAIEICTQIVRLTDVLIGNEGDMQDGLGVKGPDVERVSELDPTVFEGIISNLMTSFPNVRVVATTLRQTVDVHHHKWSAVVYANDKFVRAPVADLEVYDRIGGGDGFAAGLIYGILQNMDPETATKYGWAHGALLTSTPGDTTMVTLRVVADFFRGKSARVAR